MLISTLGYLSLLQIQIKICHHKITQLKTETDTITLGKLNQ